MSYNLYNTNIPPPPPIPNQQQQQQMGISSVVGAGGLAIQNNIPLSPPVMTSSSSTSYHTTTIPYNNIPMRGPLYPPPPPLLPNTGIIPYHTTTITTPPVYQQKQGIMMGNSSSNTTGPAAAFSSRGSNSMMMTIQQQQEQQEATGVRPITSFMEGGGGIGQNVITRGQQENIIPPVRVKEQEEVCMEGNNNIPLSNNTMMMINVKSDDNALSSIGNNDGMKMMKEPNIKAYDKELDSTLIPTNKDKMKEESGYDKGDKEGSSFKDHHHLITLDDLVAPPGPACVLDDPKLKAAYDYCDTTTAAVIDVAIRQATGLCEYGIEDQFKVIEAQLTVAMIEAEMEGYKDAMKASDNPNDMENKRRRVAIYGGTLSPTHSPTQTRNIIQGGEGTPESPPDGIRNDGGGINTYNGRGGNLGRDGNSPDMSVVTTKDESHRTPKPAAANRLPPRFGGGVRHHRRTHTSSDTPICNQTDNIGNPSPGTSPPPPSSSDSSPAE